MEFILTNVSIIGSPNINVLSIGNLTIIPTNSTIDLGNNVSTLLSCGVDRGEQGSSESFAIQYWG